MSLICEFSQSFRNILIEREKKLIMGNKPKRKVKERERKKKKEKQKK